MKAFEPSGFMTTDEANYYEAKEIELRSKDQQIEMLQRELKNKSDLLKTCGEALEAVVLANGPRTKQGYFSECTCSECTAVRKSEAALAALREAGVNNG